MNRKFLIAIGLIIVLVWMGVIFNFSNMNTKESNGKSIHTIDIIIEKTIDITNKVKLTDMDSKMVANKVSKKINHPLRKIAHASIYFILGILLALLLKKCHIKRFYFYSFIISFIYACTDEFHQRFVSGRTASIKDVLIDSLGCIIGLLLFYLLNRLSINRKERILECETT